MAKSTGKASETAGNSSEVVKDGTDTASKPSERVVDDVNFEKSLMDHLGEMSPIALPTDVIFTEPKTLLRYLRENKGADLSSARFSLQAEGITQDYPGFHSDMAFESLVFCKRPEEDPATRSLSNSYAIKLNNMLPSSNTWIDEGTFVKNVLAALATINLTTEINFDDEILKLPFANFSIINYKRTRNVSPFVFGYICDHYSPKLEGFGELGYSIVYKNLGSLLSETLIKEGDKTLNNPITEGLLKLRVENGVVESELCDRIIEKLALCEDVFFRVVLPLALLDKDVKKSLQATLLTEGFLQHRKGHVRAMYICFLSKISFVRRILDIASAKLEEIATLDYNPDAKVKKKTSATVKVTAPTREEYFYPGKEEHEGFLATLQGHVSRAKDVENLDNLAKKYSNLQSVVDFLKPYVRHSFLKSQPLSFPPILIAGPPGIGKSKLMQELFSALGFKSQILHASQFTSGWALVGMQKGWNSAHQGIVAETMQDQLLYNPLICFDEVDKIKTDEKHVTVESALMRLLEPIEAKNFRDANFNAHHDVSGVNWVFSCNQPRTISFALRTRMHIIYVYPPTNRNEIDTIHLNMWSEIIESQSAKDDVYPTLSKDILDYLAEEYYDELQFRASSTRLEKAMKVLIAGMEPGFKRSLNLNDLLDPKGSTVIKPIVLH
ncbi:AAA family ATPase (plasmid) [Pseudomonas silesiensis]|uniref:AAA family ATPase n=1 Tax=Pseudomonas silesiensis TaxID=1853130 RepID=UPI0030CD6AC7